MFRRAAFGLPTASLVILGLSAVPALAEPPAPPSTATARGELAALAVAAPHSMDGYARDKFDIWS
ncbi:HNH endonuclease, partial [Streptomyces aureus]